MRLRNIFLCSIGSLLVSQTLCLYAASLYVQEATSTHSGAVAFTIMLDASDDSINTVSAKLLYQDEFFTPYRISTYDSVISMWITPPQLPTAFLFSNERSIPFEGLIPGGFSGIRSPFYSEQRPGKLFHIELIPKKEGETSIGLSDIVLYKNDGLGTSIHVEPSTLSVHLPKPSNRTLPISSLAHQKITSNTFTANIIEESVMSNLWMVIFNEDTSSHPIHHFEVAESSTANPNQVIAEDFKIATSPYMILNQERNRYIHVKALYEDGTFDIRTIPPVDSRGQSSSFASILYGSLAILLLLISWYVFHKKFS